MATNNFQVQTVSFREGIGQKKVLLHSNAVDISNGTPPSLVLWCVAPWAEDFQVELTEEFCVSQGVKKTFPKMVPQIALVGSRQTKKSEYPNIQKHDLSLDAAQGWLSDSLDISGLKTKPSTTRFFLAWPVMWHVAIHDLRWVESAISRWSSAYPENPLMEENACDKPLELKWIIDVWLGKTLLWMKLWDPVKRRCRTCGVFRSIHQKNMCLNELSDSLFTTSSNQYLRALFHETWEAKTTTF